MTGNVDLYWLQLELELAFQILFFFHLTIFSVDFQQLVKGNNNNNINSSNNNNINNNSNSSSFSNNDINSSNKQAKRKREKTMFSDLR